MQKWIDAEPETCPKCGEEMNVREFGHYEEQSEFYPETWVTEIIKQDCPECGHHEVIDL